MLEFNYATYNQLVVGYPGYDASLGIVVFPCPANNHLAAHMRSIQFVFLNRFVFDLQSYFMDGPIMASLIKNTGEKAKESAKMGAEAISENPSSKNWQIAVY